MAFRRKVPRSVTACAVRSAVFVSARALYIRSRYQWPAKRLATVQSRPRGKRLIYGWVREASGYDSLRRAGTLPPPFARLRETNRSAHYIILLLVKTIARPALRFTQYICAGEGGSRQADADRSETVEGAQYPAQCPRNFRRPQSWDAGD